MRQNSQDLMRQLRGFRKGFPGQPGKCQLYVSLLLVIRPLPRELVACEPIQNANPQAFIKMPGLLSPQTLLFGKTGTGGGDEG